MSVKEDINGLKMIVSKFVDEPYRPAMNLKAISIYHKYYSTLNNQNKFEVPKCYPFESAVNELIYESNARFRR